MFSTLARSLFVLLVALGAACSTPAATTPGPVDSLCAAGEQKCFGNIMASCGSGGKKWNLTQCGADKTCQTKETAGTVVAQCANTKCARGSSVCVGSDSSKSCSLDGMTETVTACTSNESCSGGICVTKKCAGTVKKCGWKAVLACTSSAWSITECKDDELCDPATFTCVKQACSPTAAMCTDASNVQVCSETGSVWNVSACGAGEICDDAICHLPVNGVGGVDDAVSGDDSSVADAGKDGKVLLDAPQKDNGLEPLDEFSCILSETKNPPDGAVPQSFPNASVTWLDTITTLMVSGVDGNIKVEVQIGPIEEFQTGDFTKKGGEASKARVGYSSGEGPVSAGQFEYEATDYALHIESFGAQGDRIIGTFSADLEASATGKKMYVVDGKFNIKRN